MDKSGIPISSVCLAILNYNGKHHLAELLPTALEAVKEYGQACPVIVLDNQSEDDDASWIRTHYPAVEVVISPKNDFLFSYNWLLANRNEDTFILLNNDLKLSANFVSCLARHFADPNVFAASSKALDWEGGQINSGPCCFRVLRRGWILAGFQTDQQVLSYTLFCSGGFMAVDRRKFLELGGFDRLYHPAYGEDKDLCYRAWCRGWKSVYDPSCHVFHREGGSWDVSANRSKKLIALTNYFFMWRNIRHIRFRISHAIYLVWLRIRKLMEGDQQWLATFDEAKRIWRERRRTALKNAPAKCNFRFLQEICGAPIQTRK